MQKTRHGAGQTDLKIDAGIEPSGRLQLACHGCFFVEAFEQRAR